LRPGRIDLSIELSYISLPVFKKFINIFFDKKIIDFNKALIEKITGIKEGITIANLQNEFIIGLSLQDMIEKYCIV
jgi:hypothetical protein